MAYAETLTLTLPQDTRGKIGPNAVLQTEIAIREAGGQGLAERIFAKACLGHLLRQRPDDMIDEAIPRALFNALFETVPRREGIRIALDAGRRTGAYILRNRIPMPVRVFLKLLPAPLASPLLLSAIQRHAWTFAGSGACSIETGEAARLIIADNPMKMPVCAWHTGVLEVLFKELVSPRTGVVHRTHRADEPTVCTFTMDWR